MVHREVFSPMGCSRMAALDRVCRFRKCPVSRRRISGRRCASSFWYGTAHAQSVRPTRPSFSFCRFWNFFFGLRPPTKITVCYQKIRNMPKRGPLRPRKLADLVGKFEKFTVPRFGGAANDGVGYGPGLRRFGRQRARRLWLTFWGVAAELESSVIYVYSAVRVPL